MYRYGILIFFIASACNSSANGTDAEGTTDDGPPTLTGDTECQQALLFPELTAHAANGAYADPWVVAACEDDSLVVAANGIPDFEFIEMTPNGLAAQDWNWEITLNPQVAAATTDVPLLGTIGFSVTGLPLFGPNEGAFPDPYGDPVYNSIVDQCLGHTAQGGMYHFHAMLVQCITGAIESPEAIVGYAMDGFPIYGTMGCLDTDCNDVVEFESSWDQTGDPTTYAWDNYSYSAKNGEQFLDECNGRVGPDGTYRYHITPTFPYLLGCYAGTAVDGGGGDPGGGEDPGDGGGVGDPPDCDDVPAGMPCCGDDICDGPETADNCSVDCT